MEQFVNYAPIALAAPCGSGDASITVTNPSALPTSGTYRLVIDFEILCATIRSGAVVSVTRGTEGTAAVAHALGAAVVPTVTAAALLRLRTDAKISRFSICATVCSTGNDNTLPKKVGAVTFDPTIWQIQTGSTVILHVLLETTNAGNAASVALQRLTGTGSPVIITTQTTTSLVTTELTVDLSSFFAVASSPGIFVLLLSLATVSLSDLATISGGWLEIDL